MKNLRVWEACFAPDTHAMESLRVWEACFVADTHVVESLRVWEACFVADTHAVESLRVWEACFVADTHVVESLWVWEAYFVADTHARENLRVWEAYSIADTQIVKTRRYITGTLYFKKTVAPAGYKNKLTVNRRRHLARVLSSLMCRCDLFPSESDVSVSYTLPRATGILIAFLH